MTQAWMVRAGEGGYLAADFQKLSCVAIGWERLGDLHSVKSQEALRELVDSTYPDAKLGNRVITTSTVWKFRETIRRNDQVVTYDPAKREYSIGSIAGDYEYSPQEIPGYPHLRKVNWESRVSRDALSPGARNSLGSTVTIFKPGADVMGELERLSGRPVKQQPSVDVEPERPDLDSIREDLLERSHEFIKDKILALGADDLERLVASLLRAMGYKARVTPKGPDKGRDVIASPDGLNFQQPRIVAEVKHRSKDATSPEMIRSFLGGLRDGEAGLYVSTGGFTREAEYEAVRAKHPLTLVKLGDLAELIVEHYDRFDTDGRALIPLVRLYWPVS